MPRLIDGIQEAADFIREAQPFSWSKREAEEQATELEAYGKTLPWEPPQTPYVAVDCIIVTDDFERIALINRKFPPLGLALPGGFVDMNETLAHAAAREVKEEVGIDVEVIGSGDGQPLYLCDTPDRDPRRHVITGVFMAIVPKNTKLIAGDDAAGAQWYPLKDITKREIALGHGELIKIALSRHESRRIRLLEV